MEIGSLSANKNILIVFLILIEIGLGVAYYMYKYTPLKEDIVVKQKIRDDKKKQTREIELTKKLLRETKEEMERLKSEIARIEKFFPQEVFVPRVLVLVENLAIATHVNIKSVKPSSERSRKRGGADRAANAPVAPQGGAAPAAAPAAGAPGAAPGAETKKNKLKFDDKKEYSTSDINFTISGPFNNIYNFLNELTTFPKLVVVDNLSISSKKGGDSKSEELTEAGRPSSPETGKEVEMGNAISLEAEMPLTFYIQKVKSPDLVVGGGSAGAGTGTGTGAGANPPPN